MNYNADLVTKYAKSFDEGEQPLSFLIRIGPEVRSKVDMAILLRELYGLGLPDSLRTIGDYVRSTQK